MTVSSRATVTGAWAAVSIATAAVLNVELARMTGELTPAWLDRNLESTR